MGAMQPSQKVPVGRAGGILLGLLRSVRLEKRLDDLGLGGSRLFGYGSLDLVATRRVRVLPRSGKEDGPKNTEENEEAGALEGNHVLAHQEVPNLLRRVLARQRLLHVPGRTKQDERREQEAHYRCQDRR